MSKGKIIAISIIGFIVVLSTVLFGFVFCVRKQSVSFVTELSVTEQQILESANIKNGRPILLLDKEQAIQNIETKFPNIKVIQIKTTSLFAVEIVVRERFSLYYTENEDKNHKKSMSDCFKVSDVKLRCPVIQTKTALNSVRSSFCHKNILYIPSKAIYI